MCLPLRFKYKYQGRTKCSLFFPYSFWDFRGFRHTGHCIVMLTSLTSPGLQMALFTCLCPGVETLFQHFSMLNSEHDSLSNFPSAPLSWHYQLWQTFRKALRMQMITEGHRAVTTSYWMVGLIALRCLATLFSLTPSRGRAIQVSKSKTLHFSLAFPPASLKAPFISLHFLIPQAQNSFTQGSRASPPSLLLFIPSHLGSGTSLSLSEHQDVFMNNCTFSSEDELCCPLGRETHLWSVSVLNRFPLSLALTPCTSLIKHNTSGNNIFRAKNSISGVT